SCPDRTRTRSGLGQPWNRGARACCSFWPLAATGGASQISQRTATAAVAARAAATVSVSTRPIRLTPPGAASVRWSSRDRFSVMPFPRKKKSSAPAQVPSTPKRVPRDRDADAALRLAAFHLQVDRAVGRQRPLDLVRRHHHLQVPRLADRRLVRGLGEHGL